MRSNVQWRLCIPNNGGSQEGNDVRMRPWVVAVVLSGIFVGCGVIKHSSDSTNSMPPPTVLGKSPASHRALDQMPLIRRLSIIVENGRLIARVTRQNGTPLVSRPISLKAALLNPSIHYGIMFSPTWTLVFGIIRNPSLQVLISGHMATQNPTPHTIKPGYTLWDYFLRGRVTKPSVKFHS